MNAKHSVPCIELWLPVLGYEELYEVSNFGNVRSLPRAGGNNRSYGGKVLVPIRDDAGYLYVNLSRDSKSYPFRIHVLVLEAFVGPKPDEKLVMRHLNDIKTDNRYPENLCWGTESENSYDAVRNGVHPMIRKRNAI